MPYLIGTDEAGYAPFLGPLVISASVWWVAEPLRDETLYQRLRRCVCKKTPRAAAARRVAIADSKALYSPAVGLHVLERGVLAALALVDHCPDDWLDVWQLLDAGSLEQLDRMPWHDGYDVRLPLAADPEDLAKLVPRLRREFEAAGVRLVTLASRAVFPDEFNRSNDQTGNKAETLSKITLALVADALACCPHEPVTIVCDKHGGRNRYHELLQLQFPDPWIEVVDEGAARSTYRWSADHRPIEIHFLAGGEDFLPTALASMASKYLRELAMRAFNDYWCGRVRDLAPTAGYPVDAHRFKAAIQPLQTELGIADHLVWRTR